METTNVTLSGTTDSNASLLESLLASPQAQRKLSAIGENTPSSHGSLTSVEETRALIESIRP